jgi:hypothetical protein
LGLNEKAQANVRSMRRLTDEMNVFTCSPCNDLLSGRQPNEAYCIANPGREYAVYFPNGGEVDLDVRGLGRPAAVRWLRIMKSEWSEPERVGSGSPVTLQCPSQGHWAVLIQ